ncbi:hypothetical protein Avbf_09180 [Armadillidium vulgare]|nr:hypothetical protein Avbf_09180 [Armadillidium vulgare]
MVVPSLSLADVRFFTELFPVSSQYVRGHTDLRLICHKYESFHDPKNKHKDHHHGGHQKEHHNHADHVTVIVHFTVGCRSGYRCMRIYRRDMNIVQVQFGSDALNSKEACNNFYWEPSTAEYVTLVAQGDNRGSCGPYGRYHIPEPQNLTVMCNIGDRQASSFSHLTIGCSQHDTLQLHEKCPTQEIDSYQCHGEWKSNGVTYVVASPVSRPSGAPKRVCFAYTHNDHLENERSPSHIIFTARHDTCISRSADAHLTLNATLIGQCTEASGMASGSEPSLKIARNTNILGGFLISISLAISFNVNLSLQRFSSISAL